MERWSVMSAIFVHVSDIHFGQERDHVVHIHDDVKQQLILDAAEVISGLPAGGATGILVTGDIAQTGKWHEYESAGRWLDALAAKIGCPIHRVQMVPGNHDVDRSKLSIGGKALLEFIRKGGPAEYEQVVANPSDRASLFARFEDYGRFCIGYECDLDETAGYATNLRIELAPGRFLRFIRFNSALLCTGNERDDDPELMIGARQFPIPRNAGEENVVLVHHPLHWFKDAEEVRKYVRSRARVLISGHEHNPKVVVDKVEEGCDLMLLAAGAAVPFSSDETFTYTYNIIEFDWDEEQDALAVRIHPRAWSPAMTCFQADTKRLGGEETCVSLGSPNFRKCAAPRASDSAGHVLSVPSEEAAQAIELVPAAFVEGEVAPMPPAVEGYELALLRFFRDLLENERLRILLEMNAISEDSDERMTQGVERKLFDWLAREGRLPEVTAMMDRLIAQRSEGNL